MSTSSQLHYDIQPHVFLSSDHEQQAAILTIIQDFNLNEEQALAFRIVADHTLANSRVGPQLLMGVFGEGGTGKSRVIEAIRAWFTSLHRANELVVTATTGTTAVKIAGATLHSAVGISIKTGEVNRTSKISKAKATEWADRRYIIIDEVSMMDCKLITSLHAQLGKIKADTDMRFGGVNIMFFGDFLQILDVSHGLVHQ